MDVKTESKIILTFLLILPLGAGVLMLMSDAWGIYPYIAFLIGLLGLLYLWVPRKWFGRQDKRKKH